MPDYLPIPYSGGGRVERREEVETKRTYAQNNRDLVKAYSQAEIRRFQAQEQLWLTAFYNKNGYDMGDAIIERLAQSEAKFRAKSTPGSLVAELGEDILREITGAAVRKKTQNFMLGY